jgi:L-ribulose-5-phosphate 4-epimerase
MSKYLEIQTAAYNGNLRLPKLGLVIFTFGNVSVADHGAGVFAIKPSGIEYEELTPEKMVVVDFEGNIVEGKLRPSSDTKTHAVLYKHCEGMNAIVHTHSTYATAWAQSLRDIPTYGTTHADHSTSDIPCAPPMEDKMIEGDYERETGFQILNCLKERGLDYSEMQMILVGSHAPFAWGTSMEKAVYHAAVLEELARIAYITEQVNPSVVRLKESLIKKHYERKHGKDAYYGQGRGR